MPFNIKTDDDPDHYVTFVESLTGRASSAIKNAGNDIDMRFSIHAFLEEGYNAGLTSEELTDCFCVDTPSVVDRADLTPAKANEVVAIFDQINSQIRRDRKTH